VPRSCSLTVTGAALLLHWLWSPIPGAVRASGTRSRRCCWRRCARCCAVPGPSPRSWNGSLTCPVRPGPARASLALSQTTPAVTVTDQAGGLGFPGAAQAIQITRRTRRAKPKPGTQNRWHTKSVYAFVTLPAEHATPVELATWIRQHWHIDNTLHW